MKRLLTATLVAVCCMSCEHKQDARPEAAPQPTEATSHEFLSAVINSLSQVHSGFGMVQSAAAQNELVELMTANQNATIAIRMGENLIKPFANSRDSTRQSAVSAIVSSYDMFQTSLQIQLAGYEHIDSAQTTHDFLGLRRRASDAKVAYQQGSAILADAVALAFGSSVVEAPGDTAHIALNMSDADRLSLVAELDSLMGPEVRGTHETTGAMSAARDLRRALDKPWRTAR